MQLDESKIAAVGDKEKGEGSLSSLSVIERELRASRRPPEGEGEVSAWSESSDGGGGGLTALPRAFGGSGRGKDEDAGGWKVFRGKREIQSYQKAGKGKEGGGKGGGTWGRFVRKFMG